MVQKRVHECCGHFLTQVINIVQDLLESCEEDGKRIPGNKQLFKGIIYFFKGQVPFLETYAAAALVAPQQHINFKHGNRTALVL